MPPTTCPTAGDLCGVDVANETEESRLYSGVVVPPATAAATLGGILGIGGVPAYPALRARKSGVPIAGVPPKAEGTTKDAA